MKFEQRDIRVGEIDRIVGGVLPHVRVGRPLLRGSELRSRARSPVRPGPVALLHAEHREPGLCQRPTRCDTAGRPGTDDEHIDRGAHSSSLQDCSSETTRSSARTVKTEAQARCRCAPALDRVGIAALDEPEEELMVVDGTLPALAVVARGIHRPFGELLGPHGCVCRIDPLQCADQQNDRVVVRARHELLVKPAVHGRELQRVVDVLLRFFVNDAQARKDVCSRSGRRAHPAVQMGSRRLKASPTSLTATWFDFKTRPNM